MKLLVVFGIVLASLLVIHADSDVSSEEDNITAEEFEDSEEDVLEKKGHGHKGSIWAVLVAGSSGWGNYRHQADIAHAYKLFIKRGVKASNIIVLMYDDVASDPSNPQPGVLINKPDGPDVYKGIKIDYKGDDVTPSNFLNVLKGNKGAMKNIGSGRVLNSNKNDQVFINFADHGGTGLLGFPNDVLYASDLIDALNTMSQKKMYKQVVFYVEACEAGSMFDNLLQNNKKILVSTASAPDESSWGYYCDYEDYPCLGDLYSINWMEHLDASLPKDERIFQQYEKIRTMTLTNEEFSYGVSHVNLYGDFNTALEKSSVFLGPHNVQLEGHDIVVDDKYKTRVSSRNVTMYWLERQLSRAKTILERRSLKHQINSLQEEEDEIDYTMNRIIQKFANGDDQLEQVLNNKRPTLTMEMFKCYKKVVGQLNDSCFNVSKKTYVFKHLYKLANVCEIYEKQKKEVTHQELNYFNDVCQ